MTKKRYGNGKNIFKQDIWKGVNIKTIKGTHTTQQSFPGSLVIKNLLPMQESQETWVWFLGQKYLLQVEMTTHSSILAWKTPWTEEPGGLQFMVLQRVRHNSDKWAYNPGTKEIQIKKKGNDMSRCFQKKYSNGQKVHEKAHNNAAH